jgi:hypothetical protein
MQQDWNIRMRAEACDATGKPFAEGEIFHTALYREGDGFLRRDLCEEAWNVLTADPQSAPPFSSWRSKFEPPAPPAPEALPKDDAEGMLRRLLESNDPAHANTRYLLAVMLERKRILRPQPSEEATLLVYEHAKTGETFLITDPRLSLADLAAVQEEVSALLSGLSAPPSSASETSSGETQEEGASHPIPDEETAAEGTA